MCRRKSLFQSRKHSVKKRSSDFVAPRSVSPRQLQWFGLRVRSNFERQVSRLLRAKGVEEYLPAYRTRRAWSDRVRELELAAVRKMIASRAAVEPWPFLRLGQRVRVHRGPLDGVEGILLQVKSSY